MALELLTRIVTHATESAKRSQRQSLVPAPLSAVQMLRAWE